MSRFVLARTLGEALETLSEEGARPLAGGTDLMVDLRARRLAGHGLPPVLVDVSRLPELRRLRLDRGSPYLGAGLTFAFLERDPRVAAAWPVLAAAAALVGSPQVRNTATIGGNAANASPAADGTTALTALGARADIASLEGRRQCPLEELITSPGRTTLAPGELILGYAMDLLPGHRGQVFAKVGRRQAVSVARLNLAVCLDRDLADPRVVLGACFPSPRRLADVEDLLMGGQPGPDLWRAAGEKAAGHFTNVCGWRSSAAYKVPAIRRVVAQSLARAWRMSGGAR